MGDKFVFEEKLVTDEKIRENLRKLYSNLAKDIESINYDTYKDMFSLDDDFVIMRQKTEDVLKEDDFDLEGDLPSLMLGENASYHIEKHLPTLKLIGSPRRVKIPPYNSQKERKNYFVSDSPNLDNSEIKSKDFKVDIGMRHEQKSPEFDTQKKETVKKLVNPFAREQPKMRDKNEGISALNSKGGKAPKNIKKGTRSKVAPLLSNSMTASNFKTFQDRKPSRSLPMFEGNEQKQRDRWSDEVKGMKEKSKKIVDDMFKTSNLFLNCDLSRPLPFQERFNNGDSVYIPRVTPEEMSLMDKLIKFANKEDEKDASTTTNADGKPSGHLMPLDVKNFDALTFTSPSSRSPKKGASEARMPRSRLFEQESPTESSEDSEDIEENDAWFKMRSSISRKERPN